MSTEVVKEFDADYTGRHFLSVEDMSSDDVMRIIERGRQFKAGDARAWSRVTSLSTCSSRTPPER